jgi:hypothetical protein
LGVSADLLVRLPVGQELTTFQVSEQTGIDYRLVQARMGWLHRQGDIEHLRDEPCDPSLGAYDVGVYRRRA